MNRFLMRCVMLAPILLSAANVSVPPLVLDGVVNRSELLAEIQTKLARVHQFLVEHKLDGVLLSNVQNFSWITAGLGNNMIVLTTDTGTASLLILRDGHKYVIANNSEMPRLEREDLAGLHYEAESFPWYEENTARLNIIRRLAGGRSIGTDTALGNLPVVAVDFARLRYQLTDSEIKKYRWVGKQATEAVIATCRQLAPGMSERDIEAIAANELRLRGLQPTVPLMGVDHRVYDYHHHTPTDLRLAKYAIVNVCAKRWGLVASVARFVHFGPFEPDLKRKIAAAMEISAQYEAHSHPGVTGGQMLAWTEKWFDEAAFPGLWQDHHQGGAIGYAERE